MKFDKEALNFLSGKNFSEGKAFSITNSEKYLMLRMELLENLSKEKTVIHFGFADHIPLIDKKIAQNNWLHARLLKVANKCVGLDLNQDAVKFIKMKYDFNDIFAFDVFKNQLPETIKKESWDLVIMGEILEHVDNPVVFLIQMRTVFQSVARQLVVTVPNGFELTNFQYAFKQQELINTDHRYWFTPYTLAKIGYQAGLSVTDFYFCQSHPENKLLKKMFLNQFPAFRSTLIMIFNMRSSSCD